LWRSGDEYDREAIAWVMACTSHFPGAFLRSNPASLIASSRRSAAGENLLPRRLKSGQ